MNVVLISYEPLEDSPSAGLSKRDKDSSLLFSLLYSILYDGLYVDKQQRIGRRNGHGRGFVQTSR